MTPQTSAIAAGVIAALLLLAFMWGACIAAGRADDATARFLASLKDASDEDADVYGAVEGGVAHDRALP